MVPEIRILILEDEDTRVLSFKDRFEEMQAGGTIVIHHDHVKHAQDCIEKLKGPKYDLILLDHDLGGQQMVGEDHEDCGSRVADFLVDNPDVRLKHGSVLVHSFNNVAGPKMAKRLKSAWVPGLWLRDEWHSIIRFS